MVDHPIFAFSITSSASLYSVAIPTSTFPYSLGDILPLYSANDFCKEILYSTYNLLAAKNHITKIINNFYVISTEEYQDMDYVYTDCEYCAGAGEVSCDECYGNGIIDC